VTTNKSGGFTPALEPGTAPLAIAPGASTYPLQGVPRQVTVVSRQTVQVTRTNREKGSGPLELAFHIFLLAPRQTTGACPSDGFLSFCYFLHPHQYFLVAFPRTTPCNLNRSVLRISQWLVFAPIWM